MTITQVLVVGSVLTLSALILNRNPKRFVYCTVFHTKGDVYFEKFKAGVLQGCKDMNLECIYTSVPKDDIAYKDAIKDTLAKSHGLPIIARYSQKCIDSGVFEKGREIIYVKADTESRPEGSCVITWNYTDMLYSLLEKAKTVSAQNDNSIIVQDGEDPEVTLRGCVRSSKKNILTSILEGLHTPTDRIKLIILSNPNLLDIKVTSALKRTFPDTLLYAVSYSDENIDYWVGQSPEEQGFLAIVQALHFRTGEFQTKVFTSASSS